MSKILVSIAALGLVGAASLPLQANAAERQGGVTNANVQQTTDVSAQRRYWRGRHYGYRYYGPRRYYGPPRYYGRPVYRPRCYFVDRRVWNGYRWVIRPVRVCR